VRATTKLRLHVVPSEYTHGQIVAAAWEKIATYLGVDSVDDAKGKADASLEIVENEAGGLTAEIYVRIR